MWEVPQVWERALVRETLVGSQGTAVEACGMGSPLPECMHDMAAMSSPTSGTVLAALTGRLVITTATGPGPPVARKKESELPQLSAPDSFRGRTRTILTAHGDCIYAHRPLTCFRLQA